MSQVEYTPEDYRRGWEWYFSHKRHVDFLVAEARRSFPMSGSDISHPEMWKAGAWKWFFEQVVRQ